MMTRLQGYMSAIDYNMVREKTALMFANPEKFRTPEALIVYQQRMIDEDTLLNLCSQEYGQPLYNPRPTYVPQDVLNFFEQYNVVVISYSPRDNIVELGTLPEMDVSNVYSGNYHVKWIAVPIYYYCMLRERQYTRPDFFNELPPKDLWDLIVEEALHLDAADITLTTSRSGAEVYYNVRKRKVRSRRVMRGIEVMDVIKIIASSANATLASQTAEPRYFGIDLNRNNRGRVCVNKTYYGSLVTVRVLSNDTFNKTLEQLNIEPHAARFIREFMLKREKGIRLFVGETMSGKNTTILAALRELVELDRYKIVSLEQPVEILVDGIEQINCETDEEFALCADSLLRQNPDIEYFTEITARTAKAILMQANTGKMVFSTIHANSLHEVFFRLQDITGYPIDRLLLNVHSLCWQELERDESTDTIRPVNKCFYMSDDLRSKLLGTSFKEVFDEMKVYEDNWSNGDYMWVKE